jgi:predicted nucleic acid-binding protein
MKILVDTSVWFLALRRKANNQEDFPVIAELKELIRELRAQIIGPIRQELLSGISQEAKYEMLKNMLKPFDDLVMTTEDYEKAADFSNKCRKNGIQGYHVDFLICAVSYRHNMPIFTFDNDFLNYSKYLDIILHKVRSELK